MKSKNFILGIIALLFVSLTACEDQNELHEKWLQDGEEDYIGAVNFATTISGDESITFVSYITDPRVKFVTVKWNEFGVDKSVRVEVPEMDYSELEEFTIDDLWSFTIGEDETIAENDYNFTLICDNGDGINSVKYQTIGKVYGEKYRKSLINRVVKSFELLENGINLNFSGALNETDLGIELYYNNGTEDVVRVLTTEELTETIFLETPDFSTPITYSTLYQPENCKDTFKADVLTPSIKKLVNVALGKPATASGTLNDSYIAENAVDGAITDASRWINARVAGEHWLEIDLEAPTSIEKIQIYDPTPNGDFLLEIEVDGEWIDLQRVSGNTDPIFIGVYENVVASKIRYKFETFDDEGYAGPYPVSFIVRMREFEVFNTQVIQ